MTFSVKEIYYTLQGEVAHTGRPAVFCRFSGCNLWSGREADRSEAVCRFCDTDFVGTDGVRGGKYSSAEELAIQVAEAWPGKLDSSHQRFVVCTGGEPLLQVDQPFVDALHLLEFEVAIETNGTLPPPAGIDWLSVSPKVRARCVIETGDELKLVFPQFGCDPHSYEKLQFRHFYLQPMDGPNAEENVRLATEYCLKHPQWRLSLQTHKILGLQ